MCGIFCSICNDNQEHIIDKKLEELLVNRGPDCQNNLRIENILFGGFVLWQQGLSITPQPVCNGDWILLLNGDILNRDDGTHESSDTTWLSNKISKCNNEEDLRYLFKSLKGPYSVILYNIKTNSLYFARDSLGRNSLIIERNSRFLRIVSNSYIGGSDSEKLCMELPSYGLYKVNVHNLENLCLFPWTPLSENALNVIDTLKPFFENVSVCECISPEWLLLTKEEKASFDFYQLCASKQNDDDVFKHFIEFDAVKENLDKLLDLLRISVKERVLNTPNFCSMCIKDRVQKCNHSKVGILFSGGIDCTILAKIVDEFVHVDDSIELINVAFEAPNAREVNWNVPDRCTGKESYEELMLICPKRRWNFVEVNVTRGELNVELDSHIKHLIYPLNTVLDESLGCAFWFASRGNGICKGDLYKSTSRVILIGSGADELFGGYTRHRNAYSRCHGSHESKIQSLYDELEMEWQRLPSRNLGRDDRIVADNGKTSRAPFIQEDLVHFVRNLTPSQRCCFLLEQGIGDKLLLRLCGYQLGIRSAVKYKKRAIQFGARIANKHQNAKDISTHIQ